MKKKKEWDELIKGYIDDIEEGNMTMAEALDSIMIVAKEKAEKECEDEIEDLTLRKAENGYGTIALENQVERLQAEIEKKNELLDACLQSTKKDMEEIKRLNKKVHIAED